jgi:type III secretion protein J
MTHLLLSPFRLSRICRIFSLFLSLFLLVGCENSKEIVGNVDEREANEILVFLASKGIDASKTLATSASPGGAQGSQKWTISVDQGKALDAMALLNQNGLPRIKGVSLLDLFAKQGLMSSEKEELIRYQAGLSEQIASTIRKIDGVIDANVQVSFPANEGGGSGLQTEATVSKITASVYVKHQGILDDPNSHLILKVKRLVSGSVNGLDLNDVTVISDKARFSDITLGQMPENLTSQAQSKEYVSIWSIVMSKNSAARFRSLFLLLSFLLLTFAACFGWLMWKFYPSLKAKGGFKQLLKIGPFVSEEASKSSASEPTPKTKESPEKPPEGDNSEL